MQRDGHGAAKAHHPQGGQADGAAGRRRPRLPTAQVCLLHERHRAHVPLPVAGENHPVPGNFFSCFHFIVTRGPISHKNFA